MSSRKVKGSAAVVGGLLAPRSPAAKLVAVQRCAGGQDMFGQKPKPPLVLAIGMVNDAMEVAYAHLRNAEKMNNEAEFEQVDMLESLLSVNGEITKYILQGMRKRAKNG